MKREQLMEAIEPYIDSLLKLEKEVTFLRF
jgi:hypothetical protein